MHRPTTFADDVKHCIRGLLMGAADIVPGVSGGTVALVVGIYERLVTAISHFDLTLLGHVKDKRWHDAAAHIDLRFLIALGVGILSGIAGLASLMNHLLLNYPTQTSAVFFGLILASSILVARMVERRNSAAAALAVIGTAFAFWLVGRLPAEAPPSLGYLFACGVIAISAMILPGISGAFILLLMGQYAEITGAIRNVIHFRELGSALPMLIVFALGCGLGLLGFSKFLRWLLARHESETTALLCGFMLGSLRKIWPFKVDMTPDVEKLKLKTYQNVLPELDNGGEWAAIGLAVLAFAIVLSLDFLSRGRAHQPPLEAADHPTPEEA